MRRIAAAVATAAMLSALPGFAATGAASSGSRETVPAPMHEKYDAQPSRGATAPAHVSRERRPHEIHRHRITAIVVYVPAFASVGPSYYYVPSAPSYVDRDPPDYAYREPNGFYYWCPDPAGYYPDQLDCPIGWRLVAP